MADEQALQARLLAERGRAGGAAESTARALQRPGAEEQFHLRRYLRSGDPKVAVASLDFEPIAPGGGWSRSDGQASDSTRGVASPVSVLPFGAATIDGPARVASGRGRACRNDTLVQDRPACSVQTEHETVGSRINCRRKGGFPLQRQPLIARRIAIGSHLEEDAIDRIVGRTTVDGSRGGCGLGATAAAVAVRVVHVELPPLPTR